MGWLTYWRILALLGAGFYCSNPLVRQVGANVFEANEAGYWAQEGARIDYISVSCLKDPVCLAKESDFHHRQKTLGKAAGVPLWCDADSRRWMLDDLKIEPSATYSAGGKAG